MVEQQSLDITRSSAATFVPPSARQATEVAKLVDVSRCIGCKACQAACMEWNDLRDPVGQFNGAYTNPPDLDDQTWCLMRFTEAEIDGTFRWLILKDGCMHCSDPGCLRACPAPGAVVQHANGIVDFQEEYCTGCGYCISGCPFNIPRLRRQDSRVYKCTLCSDRVAVGLEPACVKTCPTQALTFGAKTDMLAMARGRLEDLHDRGFAHAAVYDPPGVRGTHVLFVLPHGDRPAAYGLPDEPRVSPLVDLWRSGFARGLGVFTMFAVLSAGILHYMRYGPLEAPKDEAGDLIVRHPVGERVTHWAVAIAFVFLFLSGLAMFHPVFYWFSMLFGSGQLMRALHPLAGVALTALFYPYAWRVWRDNRWLPADTGWVTHMWAFMRKDYHGTDTGKYNGGQKLMFWSMVPIIALLLVTGIVIWQPWFAPAFPPVARRLAGLLHAACAFAMFVGIGIHWYAAYWTRGSIRAMVRGTVTRQWAKFNHPAWYREVTGERGPR